MFYIITTIIWIVVAVIAGNLGKNTTTLIIIAITNIWLSTGFLFIQQNKLIDLVKQNMENNNVIHKP
jgi:hypothetical protein